MWIMNVLLNLKPNLIIYGAVRLHKSTAVRTFIPMEYKNEFGKERRLYPR